MRVTQSMLSSNMLRNLNISYGKMSKLQDQINSGSKITRPSDDPVIAVKGMGYRRDLAKVEQYTRNTITASSWLDSTDESLNQVGEQMKRVRELVIQAATDSNTSEDRDKIKKEIDQIRQQLQDVGNTNIGGSYIFSGTRTNEPLFIGGAINPNTNQESVKVEIYDGIQLSVNTPGKDLFNNIDDMMGKISDLLGDPTKTGEEIASMLGGVSSSTTNDDITAMHNKVLEAQADIGARQNRVEMMENRLGVREVNVTKQLRDIEQPAAILDINTTRSVLKIDSSQARRDIGMIGPLESSANYAEKGKQEALKGMARRAREGRQIMENSGKDQGRAVIQNIAQQNHGPHRVQFNVKFVPSVGSVKINFTPGTTDINIQRREPVIDAKVNKPIHEYTPGKVTGTMIQRPDVDIDVII